MSKSHGFRKMITQDLKILTFPSNVLKGRLLYKVQDGPIGTLD